MFYNKRINDIKEVDEELENYDTETDEETEEELYNKLNHIHKPLKTSKFYRDYHIPKKKISKINNAGKKNFESKTVFIPPVNTNQNECRCFNCLQQYKYVIRKNKKPIVISKNDYFISFYYSSIEIKKKIRKCNDTLYNMRNKLPYDNPSFIDARYSSIRCFIDNNDEVSFNCLVYDIVKEKIIFKGVPLNYLDEQTKNFLYLKYLQDNAIVTLTKMKNDKKNNNAFN